MEGSDPPYMIVTDVHNK